MMGFGGRSIRGDGQICGLNQKSLEQQSVKQQSVKQQQDQTRRYQPWGLSSLTLLMSAALVLSACTKAGDKGGATDANQPAQIPDVTVVSPECQNPSGLASGDSKVCRLSNGADILIRKVGGRILHQVEGVITNDDFANIQRQLAVGDKPASEQKALLDIEVQKVLKVMQDQVHAIQVSREGRVGYFSALIPLESNFMGSLKAMNFPRAVAIQPVLYDKDGYAAIEANRPEDEGLVRRGDARSDTSSLSGLKQIHAEAFKALAEQSIGSGDAVDGSSVRLGITDTGITYNHPTFLSAKTGQPRIIYMKDFTGEGNVFINPNAKFTVTVPNTGDAEDLNIDAEIIATPKLPGIPAGDDFATIKGFHPKVNADQRKILLDPASKVNLGVILEDSLQGDTEPVDINADGKLNSQLFLLYVSAPAGDFIYFDPSGTGDFRKSPAIHDWNASHEMVKIYSEKVGFILGTADLPDSTGAQKVSVKTVAMMGYDPGNHGSHVAGIAAGMRTIANDSNVTLARGVAPEAQILMNRVCSNNAGCNATNAMIDMALNGNAEVINMSLGGLNAFNDGVGVQETVVNRLTVMKNVLFVISAGNSGPGRQTIGSPSTARLSLSVGASAARSLIEAQYQWPGFGALTNGASDDFMLFFSSRGPTASGGFKPNLSAPGTELSSVQLNTAPGGRSGLDVYWGTSMAAPTATGSYALFLDAVKKYNNVHPNQKLPTDVRILRQILISSARPFDVNRFDPATGEKLKGQYTWADEGLGILDLEAAWKKILAVQKVKVAPSVALADGTPVNLDYQVVVSAVSPNGIAYDGSRVGADGEPVFADGLYLSATSTETFKEVNIARRLPETLLKGSEAGDLAAKLATTQDLFELRTVFYGADKEWMKVGTMAELGCGDAPSKEFRLIGRGVEIVKDKNGKGSLNALRPGILNVCLDRQMINAELPPGDHGALISGYLKTADGTVSEVPSFTVPVYLTVPHKRLEGSTGYAVNTEVKSFGVSRNYVLVPEGTSLVKLTLEVPALKLDARGLPAKGEECSGVELMALEGQNTALSISDRKAARVSNCTDAGAPQTNASKRSLTFVRSNPRAGIWDIHVFGQYKYKLSKFSLKVDYVTSTMSRTAITGTVKDLNGELQFNVKEASLPLVPDNDKSTIELSGLADQVKAQAAKKGSIFVTGPLGLMRAYPQGVKSVTIQTGGSPGNDIDLAVIGCPAGSASPNAAGCDVVGASGGSTDEEKVKFVPDVNKVYAVRVDGYDVRDDGFFISTESLELPTESGSVSVTGSQPTFNVMFGFSAVQLSTSPILNFPLFKSGQFSATGSLNIRLSDGTVIGSVPVSVTN